jgi:PKD repeat protein
VSLAVLGKVDLGVTPVAGVRAWFHRVAVGTSIFWFPYNAASEWDIIRYDTTTNTATRIPTGITAGFAGAALGGDGYIYATPSVQAAFSSNVTILRLNPTTNAVATTTHAGTARSYGHCQPVTTGGQHYIYAMPGGTGTSGTGNSSDVLKITCSGFTAAIVTTGNPTWVSGGSAFISTGGVARLFVSMDSSNVSGQYAGAILLSTDAKLGLVSSPAFGFASVGLGQPIFHRPSGRIYVAKAGTGGAPNKFLYYDPTIASPFLREVPWASGSSDANIGAARGVMFAFGVSPFALMPDGTIAFIAPEATTGDFVCTIDPTTNTATRTTVPAARSTMGVKVGGNGRAYWFNGQSNSDPVEWDGTTLTAIPQSNPTSGGSFALGAAPVEVGGNIYNIHSSDSGVFSSWITMIETAAPPTAVIIAAPTTGRPPLLVAFDGTTSTSPIGSALTYAWDFGDSTTSTSSMPIHTYTLPGVYTVTLTVTDSLGQTGTTTATITVRAGRRGLGLVR